MVELMSVSQSSTTHTKEHIIAAKLSQNVMSHCGFREANRNIIWIISGNFQKMPEKNDYMK